MERHLKIHDVIRIRRAIIAWVMTVALVLAGLLGSVGHAGHTYSRPSATADALNLPICNTSSEAAETDDGSRQTAHASTSSDQNTPGAPSVPDTKQPCLNGSCAFGGTLAVISQTVEASFSAQSGLTDSPAIRTSVQPRAVSLGNGFGSRAPPAL